MSTQDMRHEFDQAMSGLIRVRVAIDHYERADRVIRRLAAANLLLALLAEFISPVPPVAILSCGCMWANLAVAFRLILSYYRRKEAQCESRMDQILREWLILITIIAITDWSKQN